MNSVPTVEAGEVGPDAFLLDVRENEEWEAGHPETAVHVPMSEFMARYDEVTEAAPADGPVYVICRSGGRSGQVAQYLNQRGIDAVNVAGGVESWTAAGRALVDENGGPGRVA